MNVVGIHSPPSYSASRLFSLAAMATAILSASPVDASPAKDSSAADSAEDSGPVAPSLSASRFPPNVLEQFTDALADLDARRQLFTAPGGPCIVPLDAADVARLDALLCRHVDAVIASQAPTEDPGFPTRLGDRYHFLQMVVRRGLAAMEADHINHLEMGDVMRILRAASAKG